MKAKGPVNSTKGGEMQHERIRIPCTEDRKKFDIDLRAYGSLRACFVAEMLQDKKKKKNSQKA